MGHNSSRSFKRKFLTEKFISQIIFQPQYGRKEEEMKQAEKFSENCLIDSELLLAYPNLPFFAKQNSLFLVFKFNFLEYLYSKRKV